MNRIRVLNHRVLFKVLHYSMYLTLAFPAAKPKEFLPVPPSLPYGTIWIRAPLLGGILKVTESGTVYTDHQITRLH